MSKTWKRSKSGLTWSILTQSWHYASPEWRRTISEDSAIWGQWDDVFGYGGLQKCHDSLSRLSLSFPATLRILWKGCSPEIYPLNVMRKQPSPNKTLGWGQIRRDSNTQNQTWVLWMQPSLFRNTLRSKFLIQTQGLVREPTELQKQIRCRWIWLQAGVKWMQHIRTWTFRSLCILICSQLPGFQFKQFINELINPSKSIQLFFFENLSVAQMV